MAADDTGEKTEDATQRRREDAREKGNVARSVDLNASVHMLAAATAFSLVGAALVRSTAELLHHYLGQQAWLTLDRSRFYHNMEQIGAWGMDAVLPFMLVIFVTALLVNVAQVGFLITTDAMQPKFSRLNPLEGVKRILSVQGLVKLFVSLGKLTLLVTLAGWFISSSLTTFQQLPQLTPRAISVIIGSSLTQLAFVLSLALILLGLLDYTFQKWKFEQDLKMSKQEIRDEMKNMDGDPLVRHRRREAHRKLAQARELQDVRDADVVITNPTHISVAIKYDPATMPAPTIVAKGMGEIAMRIRVIAAEHGIPIIERKELARALYRTVKTGRSVPVEMYEVFVEIMSYVYRITGREPPDLT